MKPVVYIAATALLLAGSFMVAQNPPPPPPAQSQEPTEADSGTIRSEVTRVNMLFTVTDRKGRFVTDLVRNDFSVFENKKPQPILEFTAESDLPLRMAILIDTSGSITDRFKFQQEAATNFIQNVMRKQDKAIVVAFDSSAELVADLTSDSKVLEDAVHNLRAGGGTALYDAIYFACKERLMKDQPMYKFRRAMVVLSDGQDNASRYSRDQALEMAQRADTVIYTISTNITHIETDGDKVMRYFADETGGAAFFPFEAKDLNQSFENIANELRHQYNLFYRPEPLKNDGLYHKVQIKIKDRKDYVVRARKGYYARKDAGGA